jgi:hydrogenase maturation protease
VFEMPGEALAAVDGPPLATHAFRWDHAIAAGRAIYREAFPSEVTVFLIEAASVELGVGLSPRVAAAAGIVAERIAEMLATAPGPELRG